MQPSRHGAYWLVLAFCLLGLTGCDTIVDRSRSLLYPPEAVPPSQSQPAPMLDLSSATHPSEATPLATLTWPVPQPSAILTETLPPATPAGTVVIASSATTVDGAARPAATEMPGAASTHAPGVSEGEGADSLVFVQGEAVFHGDYLGARPAQVSVAPAYEGQAFRRGLLAAAQGKNLELLDLTSGKRISTKMGVTANVEYAELLWGAGGKHLVYSALEIDGTAKPDQRRVDMHILDVSAVQATAELGRIGRIVLDDVASVSLLRYDEDAGRLLLVPRGEEPVFTEIRFYDVASGQLVDTYPAEGQGDVVLSPDGRYLLTEQFTDAGAQFALYDLQAQGDASPRIWAHPKGAYSVFPLWSPTGDRIAYLLRRNQDGQGDPIEPLGLWVLHLASGKTERIPAEDSALSSLVSWAPQGDYIVGYYEAGPGSYYYAVRPDGGDRRILMLPPQARILGWMPYSMPVDTSSVETDPWRSRFSAAPSDPDTTAQVIAQFVQGQPSMAPSDLAIKIAEYLQQAGAPLETVEPRLVPLADGLYAAQVPPGGIYLLQDGRAQRVGSGQILLDVRLQDQSLGLISAMGEGEDLQPTFELLRWDDDETWKVVWSPQGQRYWIATDGVIRFQGEGLSALQVVGTSFGMDSDSQTWDECRACAHRRLSATWVRQNDRYEIKTSLPADAAPDQVLWDITARTPYALLHECIARLSAGLDVDDLVTDQSVVDQIFALGLLDQNRRFMPLEESANAILFEDVHTHESYLASAQDERLVRIDHRGP